MALIRWSGWVFSGSMEDWKRQYPIEWDVLAKDAGGAELHSVGSDVEVEPYEAEAGPKNPGAVIMLIDL